MAPRKKKAESTIATGDYDYETIKVKDAKGKTKVSKGNGDAVQRAMLKFTAEGGDIMKVVRANKLQDKHDAAKASNMGLFRMAVGNSLRALVRNGTPVTIGEVVVKSLEQRVALPEVKDKAA